MLSSVCLLGPQFLILATYSMVRRIKKNTFLGVSLVLWGLFWGPIGSHVCKIIPLDPAEIGQDQSRVVGVDTGLSVPHRSQLFHG